MPIKISSGDLTERVVFKQPVSSLNDEGGIERDYSTPVTTLTTWAMVERFNIKKTSEALSESLVGSLDFYVRESSAKDAITKDWIITYNGEDYTISEIDPFAVDDHIRFTAKVRTDG